MTYSDEVLADNPVGYWRLEEISGTTCSDEVGAYPGTLTGGNLDTEGAVGSGVSLDGVDDLIAADGGEVAGGSSWTFELWVQDIGEAGATSGATLISEADSAAGSSLAQLQLNSPSAGDWKLYFRDDSGTALQVADTSGVWDDGEWHHLVGVNDAGTVSIYQDGQFVDGGPAPTGAFVFDTRTFGAIRRDTPSNYANVKLDEIAVYDTALSATRVQAHYDASVPSIAHHKVRRDGAWVNAVAEHLRRGGIWV